MNNKKLLLIICGFLFTPSVQAVDSQFNLGIGSQLLTLIEKDAGTGKQLVKEQGWIPSAIYGLSWPINNWLFHAQIQRSYGVINYDGHTQPPASQPHQTETTHTITQGTLSIGKAFTEASEIYTGLQLQEMVRDVANRNNVYGATETYHEILWRLGLKQLLMDNNEKQLALWGEWQTPLYAHSTVNLRVNYDDTALSLKQGSGAAVGIDYQQRWSTKQTWFVNLAYYLHRYRDSSKEALTSQGQTTGSFASQPPIEFKYLGIYGGIVWHWH